MAYEDTNPAGDDNATKTDDYDVVFDNCEALKEARGHIPLGGSEFGPIVLNVFSLSRRRPTAKVSRPAG